MAVLWIAFVKAVWLLLPAYAANGSPPFAKGKRSIDLNKNFLDGKRIFGNGKTAEGTALGIVMGFLVGAIETFLYSPLNSYAIKFGFSLPTMNLFIGFMIAVGVLVGDMAASFIKRRFNLPRGADVPLLDQWNFVIGFVVFTFWFTEITVTMLVIMFLITPVVHRIANIVAYKIKLKKEPW